MKKIIKWIISIFKKTKFDNKLFAYGIKKVTKMILDKWDARVESGLADTIFGEWKYQLFKEFSNINVVKKMLGYALENTYDNTKTKYASDTFSVKFLLENLEKNLIKYYDAHL